MTFELEKQKSSTPPNRLDLGEFEVPSFEDWKRAAINTLKGGTYEDKLITRTFEKIPIQPIYPFVPSSIEPGPDPGVFPFRRGVVDAGGWWISRSVAACDPQEFNSLIREDTAHDVSCVVMRPTIVGDDGLRISRAADLSAALQDIPLEKIAILLDARNDIHTMSAFVEAHLQGCGIKGDFLSGCVATSFLSELARRGSLPRPLTVMYDETAAWSRRAAECMSGIKTVLIRSCPYHYGGANVVDEAALTLAECAEYMRALMDRGLDASVAARAIMAQVSIGPSFFMEIARMRALRILFAGVVRAFGASIESQRLFIHARTSNWSHCLYDPEVNILRTATAAFSAVLGGANSIETVAFDALEKEENAFSSRVARNIQLLLKEETGAGRVVDPIGGARMIESLTDDIAENAWAQFQRIEAEGGLVRALEKGIPQKWISDTYEKKRSRIATRRDVLVGTSMYPEGGVVRKAIQVPSIENTSEPLIAPIPVHRAAEEFEEVKELFSRLPNPPRVFLAKLVSKDAHRLRAGFAKSFFSVAGFPVSESTEAMESASLLKECVEQKAEIVVLCSSDEAYPDMVHALVGDLKKERIGVRVLIAGNPGSREAQYREGGVDDFIHLGTDIPARLRELISARMVAP